MIRKSIVVLAAAGLFFAGCSQEQPPAPAPPKPAVEPAAPAVAPPAPAPAVSPAAPPALAPQEPAKPTPPVASAPAKPAPAPVPVEAKPAPAPVAPKPIDVSESVILAASQGQVTLPHLAHAKLFPCATCHESGTPGKIGLTKDTAHELCRECHKAKGKGPTACGGCHKK